MSGPSRRGKAYRNKSNRELSERHPSHLKGKDIGLFYAKKKRANGAIARKTVGSIYLSYKKKEYIQSILNSNQLLLNSFVRDTSYEHLRDSTFKRDFLRIIQGDINKEISNANDNLIADARLDNALFENLEAKKESNDVYKQMQIRRQTLPSFKMQDKLIELINNNQVVVISGETGCGKTTQVAQFILDHYIENKKGSLCRVVCTQPRRISAISVAERVAVERGERLGLSVGYQIRLEKKNPREKGSISFCTTGVVLKQMENDPSLSTVSHLIMDEIHERDVLSDFLLTILKKIIVKRTDLKLILMSATLNAEAFSKYYNNAPHINIPGFTYPVKEYFLEDVLERTKFVFEQRQEKLSFRKKRLRNEQDKEFSNFIGPHIRLLEVGGTYSKHVLNQLRTRESEIINLDLILALLIDICAKEKEEGSILVFLTGYAHISCLNNKMEKSGKFPRNQYIIIPLHSQMPTVDQKQIFEPAPSGKRKIIISTNIAETSITIDDVVYVIDGGKQKLSSFDVETNTQTLLPEWVSLANASQRKGRAGRVMPGICFHLFTKARNMVLDRYQKPEVLRKRLENVILTGKMLQLGKVEPFFQSLMDAPDPKAVSLSLELLKNLNALDDDENLTPLGFHLAKLPIGPQTGKMVLFGAIFSCLDPILSVAASLDFKDAFQMPLGLEREADKKKMELSNGWLSDHLLFHQALSIYESCDNPRRFCWDNFLSSHTLKLLQDMKKQFMEYLYEMNFVANFDPKSPECNVNSDNLSLVKAVICAGLYPNVAIVKQKKKRALIYSIDGGRLEFHPKSILSKVNYFDMPLVVYFLKLKSSSSFIHDGTLVHPLPIVFFGDNYQQVEEGTQNYISINDKIRFKCSESTAMIIKDLRDKLNQFLEYKISHPGVVDWNEGGEEIKLLTAIMELITNEDTGDIDSDAFDDCD